MKKAKAIAGKVWKWIRGAAGVALDIANPTKKASQLWKLILVLIVVAAGVLYLRSSKLAQTKAENERHNAEARTVEVAAERDAIAADLEKHKLAYTEQAQRIHNFEVLVRRLVAKVKHRKETHRPDGSYDIIEDIFTLQGDEQAVSHSADITEPVLPAPQVIGNLPPPSVMQRLLKNPTNRKAWGIEDCEKKKCGWLTRAFYAAVGFMVGLLI